MFDKAEFPISRNLDGVYYRVLRDGKHVNRCFSDLTKDEQDEILSEYGAEQLRRLCRCLCTSLRQIGDELDLVMED